MTCYTVKQLRDILEECCTDESIFLEYAFEPGKLFKVVSVEPDEDHGEDVAVLWIEEFEPDFGNYSMVAGLIRSELGEFPDESYVHAKDINLYKFDGPWLINDTRPIDPDTDPDDFAFVLIYNPNV